jgi:hypothetical protein
MISPNISTDRATRPELLPVAAPSAELPRTPRPDQISTENAEFLRAELERQPEVRPEVVARGRALAQDPNYPPPHVLQSIAGQILASPDLSEDQS